MRLDMQPSRNRSFPAKFAGRGSARAATVEMINRCRQLGAALEKVSVLAKASQEGAARELTRIARAEAALVFAEGRDFRL